MATEGGDSLMELNALAYLDDEVWLWGGGGNSSLSPNPDPNPKPYPQALNSDYH